MSGGRCPTQTYRRVGARQRAYGHTPMVRKSGGGLQAFSPSMERDPELPFALRTAPTRLRDVSACAQRSAHRACATEFLLRLPCIVGCRAGGNPWLGPVPLPLAVTMATLEASASAPPLDSLESMPSSQPRFLSSVYLGHQCPEAPAGAVASILSQHTALGVW